MRKILYILLLGVILVGCEREPDPVPETSSQVLIMYMIANNNLEEDLNTNVNQVLKSVTRSNFPTGNRLFVLFDGLASTTLLELSPPKQGKAASWQKVETYEDFISTDPEQMKEFLERIKEIAPSEHYGIILSSHGTGWIPGDLINSLPYQSTSGIDGTTTTQEHDLSWIYESGMTRSFGQDGSRANTMSIPDIVYGLSPIHFDYVMFDACFMGSVELLYALRNSTDYVVASPIEIMAWGFPYQMVTPYFFDKNKTLEERLTSVATGFVLYYRTSPTITNSSWRSAVVAITKMSEMKRLAESVGKIYAYGANNEVDTNTVFGLEGLPYHVFFDLNDYLKKLSGSTVLYEQYLEQYYRTVIFEDNTETFFSAYGGNPHSAKDICGLSTYITKSVYPKYAAAWNATEWAQKVMVSN